MNQPKQANDTHLFDEIVSETPQHIKDWVDNQLLQESLKPTKMHDFLKDGVMTVPDNINGRKGQFLAHSDPDTFNGLQVYGSRERAEIQAQNSLKDSSVNWHDYFIITTFVFMGDLLFAIFIKPTK